MVNGLRIFIRESAAKSSGDVQVFYSRRADGPYYRWSYEPDLKQWRSARVHGRQFPPSDLCVSSWKNIPSALQNSLIAHYQE